MHSKPSGEGEIRSAMVEADLVASLIALPAALFRTTSIPARLWILTKDKSSQGARQLEDRRGEVLFIDARGMGEMVDRTERILTEADLARIASAYQAWRGTPSARQAGLAYEDKPGFCFSADLEAVRQHGYMLTPGRYVDAEVARRESPRVVSDELAALTRDLYALFD